jgi:hypothetical protein
MLLSRFWYILLAVAAAAATAAAMLALSVINGRSDEALANSLRRDRAMVDTMLRLEARSRLDRIAFITVDSKLGALLKQAQDVTDDKKLRELNGSAKELLRAHVGRMAEAAGGEGKRSEVDPDIVFALDNNGRIIAQLGPLEANPPGASLQTFPLVRRALQGYVRDDVWIYDRRVYRMAARPVMAGTDYAGAIVHGYRLEKGLPEKLSASLGGATVAFFYATDMLGNFVPTDVQGAPQPAEIASAVPRAIAAQKFQTGQASDLVDLQSGGRAVFVPITGAAATGGVGYAIARPRRLLTSPMQIFDQVSTEDRNALPWPILGGGALGAALIGLLFIYLERDRHLKALLKKTGDIASGERERLIVTEWRGGYRQLADRINQAIDKEVERAGSNAPVARKKANLDELLGPTPEATGNAFFGFADEASKDAPAPAAAPPTPSKAAAAPQPAPKPPQPQAPPPKPAAAANPAPAFPVMPMVSLQPATSVQPAAPAGVKPPAPTRPDDAISFDEDAHFREVYDQYVATRKQCGEPIDNLTFEKFGVTLRKTRDQIVEKQGVKFVRFTVQVKEGKAALKAQPIKR